jgi:ubiquinone/menaquinone biosynthesis C-methylase UbiE
MSGDELARIRQVYAGYGDANFGATRWSPQNRGNQSIAKEREAIIGGLLHAHGYAPLGERRVLDIGCGGGDVLAGFAAWGGRHDCLVGLELLAQRAAAAHARHPQLLMLQGNAAELGLDDGSFDLIVFFTVFSSVLDPQLRVQIATEASRVLRPGGAIVWYDLRTPNPRNTNIRPLGREEIQQLFPGLTPHLRTATVLPPLARRLGKTTAVMYPSLGRFAWLHTHYIGLLIDERRGPTGSRTKRK